MALSELDWLQVYYITHWWKIVLRTGASLPVYLWYFVKSEQQSCWSDCADAQAGLRLCCSQTPKEGFLTLRPIYGLTFHCHVILTERVARDIRFAMYPCRFWYPTSLILYGLMTDSSLDRGSGFFLTVSPKFSTWRYKNIKKIKGLQACNIPRHRIFTMQRKSFWNKGHNSVLICPNLSIRNTKILLFNINSYTQFEENR